MRMSDLLRMSINSLKRRKLRTFLTVLGVVIGTASIVVMISLGLGLQQSMYEEVEQNGGTTSLTVRGQDSYYYSDDEQKPDQYVTDDTLKEIRGLEYVVSAEPVIETNAIVLKGKYYGHIMLRGMSRQSLEEMNINLQEGGRLPDPESASLELVIGNNVVEDFYEKATDKSYWETGELPDIDFQKGSMFLILDVDNYYQMTNGGGQGSIGEDGSVQAVKNPKKYVVTASGLVAGGIDDYNPHCYYVYCDVDLLKASLQKEFRGRTIPGQPTTKSGKPYSKFVYSNLTVKADKMEHVEELAATIRSMGYEVYTNAELIKSMQSQFAMVQAVLGGIGAVSLFVAAIGIANTMMMSIYERTKEIGVMKVIGCSLGNIRQLFLIEAAFIGFMGGVLGNMLSFLMSFVINSVVPAESMGVSGGISYIPLWLVALSMGFAVLVGMAAGFFPALRAMKLSPLAAIRTQ